MARAILKSAIGRANIQILACAVPLPAVACVTTAAALTPATGGSAVGYYLGAAGRGAGDAAKALVHGTVGGVGRSAWAMAALVDAVRRVGPARRRVRRPDWRRRSWAR